MSVALVLKDIPLENIVMVQYPSKTGGTGIFAGKVQPITSVANALFAAIKADQPIGLDENSLEGAHGGSTLDPNAPVADDRSGRSVGRPDDRAGDAGGRRRARREGSVGGAVHLLGVQLLGPEYAPDADGASGYDG